MLFDIAIPTPKGMLFAMYIKREKRGKEKEIVQATVDAKNSIPIQQAHDHLGHLHEDITRKVAKRLGWTLSRGSLKPCEACAAGKAKQKNVPKDRDHEVAKVRTKLESFLTSRQSRSPMERRGASTNQIGGLLLTNARDYSFLTSSRPKMKWQNQHANCFNVGITWGRRSAT